jgi:hypothetical protein
MGDQDNIGENLRAYLQAFSHAVRDIFESCDFHTQVDRLQKAKLLHLVTEKCANIDLRPAVVGNAQMGTVVDELIRTFAALSNETAGEHFTPREVIWMMVNLMLIEDDDVLTKPGVVRSIYDPTAGTGGMLSVAGEHIASLNKGGRSVQEKEKALLNPIIDKVNELFNIELTYQDKQIHLNNAIMGKLSESKTLKQHAANNTKEQFSDSPDLKDEIMNEVMGALDAHRRCTPQLSRVASRTF